MKIYQIDTKSKSDFLCVVKEVEKTNSGMANLYSTMHRPDTETLEALFPDRPITVRHAGGASGIPTWRVSTPLEEFAVKLYPQEHRAAGQARLMQLLREAGIPVLKAHMRYHTGTWALVTSWLPAKTIAQTLLTTPECAQALGLEFGRVHAALHAVRFPLEVVQQLPALQEVPIVGGDAVLHLDYHLLNVLCDGSSIIAVLDWENVRRGCPLADVARTLSILSVDPALSKLPAPSRAVVRTFRRAYQMGYSEVGGNLLGLEPFLAWAGQFMQTDLGVGAELSEVKRWTKRWQHRATIRSR
jgi:aminoglycoside phosphotransferase (APT) family kinase protein